MRRVLGVLVAAALLPAMAHASEIAGAPSSFNLGAQIMMSVFGETGDATATRSASYGDRLSESPLRDLAFAVDVPAARPAMPPVATMPFALDLASLPSFVAPALRPATLASYPALFGANRPALAVPTRIAAAASIPPAVTLQPAPTGELALANAGDALSVQPPAAAPAAADAPAFDSGAGESPSFLRLSPHVGRMEFVAGTGERPEHQLNVSDDAYGAAATFDVRAGERHLNVDVNSSYEHLMRDDTTAYSSTPLNANWQIGGNSAPAVPNYADVSKLAVDANVALPVTHTMTLNLNYNAQRLLGAYGLPGLVNLNAIDNSYGGNVTFAIPRWSSELSVSALQYHYQDNILPANTFSDTRANVNLTVKF